MSLKLISTPEFFKSVKKLFKRYKRIGRDLIELDIELRENRNAGIHIGQNCFKIRLKNSSVPTGKSAGFRVIYFYRMGDKLYLLDIYSKSDMETISDKKIIDILISNDLL